MGLDLHINGHLQNRGDRQELLLEALESVDGRSLASIRVVAIGGGSGPLTLLYGELVVAPDATVGPYLDFGRMVVVSELLPVPDLVERLRDAFAGGRFRCGSIEVDVTLHVRSWSFARYASDRNFSRWPCVVAEGRGQPSDGWVGPFAANVDGQTLYFRDGFDIVRYITTFPEFYGDRDARVWSISVVIEDHRARVAQLDRREDRLAVHLEGHSLDGLVFAGQLTSNDGVTHPFSVPARPEVELELPPGHVSIGMGIVGANAEILDDRNSYLPAPIPFVPEAEQTIELTLVDRVEQLRNDGEHAQCEYKPWVEPSRASPKLREVAKTAVAMANGSGGAILIGVADDGSVTAPEGRIMGPFHRRAVDDGDNPTDEPPDSATLQRDAVRAYGRRLRDELQQIVEPSVPLVVEVVTLDAGPVLLFEVGPGTMPPYMIADSKDVYIRRNATNRKPTREELRMLHEPRVR